MSGSSNEEDMLFEVGAKGAPSGIRFGSNTPSFDESAAAVTDMDLEAAIGLGPTAAASSTAKSTAKSTPKSGKGLGDLQFASREVAAPAPARKSLDGKSKRAQHGPVALDAKRIEQLERPSLITRVFRALFGWLKAR